MLLMIVAACGPLDHSPAPQPSLAGSPGPAGPSPTSLATPPAWVAHGTWAQGAGAADAASPGPIGDCVHQTMSMAQEGQELTATTQVCGSYYELVRGRLEGENFKLSGQSYEDGTFKEAVTYELRYNPHTQHLEGTRNGQPIWLARATNCPSPLSICSPTLSGSIQDETGAPVGEGAVVRVQSDEPAVPFDATVTVVEGRYVAHVPMNVALRLTVTVPGKEEQVRAVTVPVYGRVFDIRMEAATER